jgi:glyoxalase family protein
VLSFEDHDGQGLELVETKVIEDRTGWTEGPVPEEHAIRGFHSVTLLEEILERTESVLVDTLGFRQVGEEENRFRYEAEKGAAGTIVDIVSRPDSKRGFVSVGTVHHVAFRASDDEHQKDLRQEIQSTSESTAAFSSRSPQTSQGSLSMSLQKSSGRAWRFRLGSKILERK